MEIISKDEISLTSNFSNIVAEYLNITFKVVENYIKEIVDTRNKLKIILKN